MTTEEMYALFEQHSDTMFLRKDALPQRSSPRETQRPDLTAFILLDRLVPGTSDILGAAEHDEVFLDVDLTKLAVVITEAHIITLLACGVRLDTHVDSLAMFV